MAADSPASKPPGFATVAKRISTWTTNALLTLIVLVAGLGFGRQVLRWWAADASPSATSMIALPSDSLGDPTQLHTLQFADYAWSLRRQSITGDKSRAIEQLRAACRDVLANMKPPPAVAPGAAATNRSSMDNKRPPGEDTFLDLLSNSAPVDQEPGKWRLYAMPEAFPMVVGLSRPADIPPERVDAPPNLAACGYRVVIWGLAMPMGNDQWTVCTFQSATPSKEGDLALADVPMPPETHRTLLLSAVDGGGIVTFGGPNRPGEWKRFYDGWSARHGWQAAVGWQPMGKAWYAKFAAPDRGDTLDVRFGPDSRGGSSGLLMMTRGKSR